MTEDTEDPWKGCNCMNCRLARIENRIEKIMNFIGTREDGPVNPPG